jgi:hypothetical protein
MKPLLLATLLVAGAARLAAEPPAALGHLETRRHIITIWAGQTPRYTVRTKDGKALAEQISLQELAAKFPELRRAVDGSHAAWAGL